MKTRRGGRKAIMPPAQRDLLRWTDCGIMATGTDCLSKYSLNSVFVFKGSLMYGGRWPEEDTLSAVLNGCFFRGFKSVCHAFGCARAPSVSQHRRLLAKVGDFASSQ